MTVVKFPRMPRPRGWQSIELTGLTNSFVIADWEVGMTERGDPQLYLLSPAPGHDCILSISRLGQLYVLEDGKGRVLFENDDLFLLADQVCGVLRRHKAEFIARLAVCWCGVRDLFEEKLEPVLAEPMEIVSHFAPHLATLA